MPLDTTTTAGDRVISPVARRIRDRAAAQPDAVCLRWEFDGEPVELTYRRTWVGVEAAAEGLRGRGIGPLNKVAVLSPNDPRVVVATIAVLTVGAAWLPVNSRESVDTIAGLLEQFGCDLLVVHPDLRAVATEIAARVPGLGGVVELDQLSSVPADRPAARAGDEADRELAAIFPTGGTTGRPKGVAFTHERLAAIVDAYAQVQAVPGDVYLAAAPLTHVGGRICLSVVASGGAVVILPSFDETAVLAAIDRHRVTTLTVTPTMLYRLLDAPHRDSYDTSSLRALVYGGAPTALSRIREALAVFGPVLEGGYGQTESPMFITRFRADEHLVDGAAAPDVRLRSVGRPTAVSEVRIVDPEGDDLPAGEPGRILVRGAFTMAGYYRDPAATASRTEADGFRSTGDIGFLDADGFLTLVGRETDLIITGGFNVYPAEVETVVAAQPGVRECAVFGLPDQTWGEAVVAVVSAEEGAVVDPGALRRAVRPLLGGVKTPKRIEVVDELPRNDNGKILKRVLVEERQA
ncbi:MULTISPECIES: class I adenylate-forming enzyme family protein [Pseudonocardia]|uniref:Long-chain-fatty-acid--CoA ligase n=2 Tax=Pseudonocardia TaxID=1847 RepID=A0A1Y2MZX2_PSEAH|nr:MULTISPECIES: AMP-binding protein [Pseudonocardia]OSY40763.1 Long-chain-fatty-acid--CoA ligase [Pseudonocardia autotrophica]TDN71930.1 acyl-CoA synthetase (AMP-forming)/AMP-acid ligase II [Pseudonocardia autotrophica]BBG02617.1 AMP-dependent acyl-CoA synthetase [Pseudonocardia autotrophica]GEC24676.1 AMP-dependent acyl-CoA synthetase [Pseudonocardia saturnea]